MASNKVRRMQKRTTAQIHRALANGFPHNALKGPRAQVVKPLSTPGAVHDQVVEPKIFAEDVGKLVDFGLDEKAAGYLKKKFRFVRELIQAGAAEIQAIYGMKRHFPQLVSILRSFGVVIPA
jgi:hypothetical protein